MSTRGRPGMLIAATSDRSVTWPAQGPQMSPASSCASTESTRTFRPARTICETIEM